MTRYWQAQAVFPGNALLVFGVEADDVPGAVLRALEVAATVPGVADRLVVTALPARDVFGFADGAHEDAQCALVVPEGGMVWPTGGEPKIGVAHPGCGRLADLCADLDAFYCPAPRGCGWNGRISGAWAVDMITDARAARGARLLSGDSLAGCGVLP